MGLPGLRTQIDGSWAITVNDRRFSRRWITRVFSGFPWEIKDNVLHSEFFPNPARFDSTVRFALNCACRGAGHRRRDGVVLLVMPFYSPLRYPGGKRRLAPAIMRLLETNGLKNVEYAEPYAGGSAVAIALLLDGYASSIRINDLSRPVFAFWRYALGDTEDLCRRIARTRVTMAEWHRQRNIYDRRDDADLSDLGFATLFLNRTNRSGIVGGGVVGGKQQTGAWGLDARFNKREIISRIRRIAEFRSQIHVYHMEAIAFTTDIVRKMSRSSFVFYDPPYIEKGEQLYLNDYDLSDHIKLAASVCKLKSPWVVTYDYAAIKHGLYPNHRQVVFTLSYSAQNRGHGREVMFLSHFLKLPTSWSRSKRFCLTPASSEHPLYGLIRRHKN